MWGQMFSHSRRREVSKLEKHLYLKAKWKLLVAVEQKG